MNIVCHYCGHKSRSMLLAVRHDTDRPESCLAWLGQRNTEPVNEPAGEVDRVLRGLTVQGGGNLDRALDEYFERIQPVYR
jgi:hypothetical protein